MMVSRHLMVSRHHRAATVPGAVRFRRPGGARARRLPGLVLAAVALGLVALPVPAGAVQARLASGRSPASGAGLRTACPPVPSGYLRCFALYRPQAAVNHAIADGKTGKAARPAGLTPEEIEHAYRLPVQRRPHQTIAVSIAYNTPRLASYLARYRHYFGLPPCTTATGCLRIVNQYGNPGHLPPSGTGTGWDLEATLDVSMISVACPHCKIIVVEASSPTDAALARTDNTAAALGAQVISNSYGGREDGRALTYARAYDHKGHTTVVAAGDLGFTAANFPADLPAVTAVGGTILARARTRRGWWERTWLAPRYLAAGGSGCSAYEPKPPWQHDPHCPGRTIADVSAVAADIPIYNPVYGGWITVAGTSVAAPLIAGIYGLAGNAAHIQPGYPYHHRRYLYDITRGTNSLFYPAKLACGQDYLCVARKGYDAPTGLGTPNGTRAF